MRVRKISSAGATVFWTPKDTPREPLVRRLRELETRLPGVRTPASALRAAVSEYQEHRTYKDRGSLLIPNKKPSKNGVSAFQTEREAERSYATYDFTAKVNEEGRIEITGGYVASIDKLQEIYDKHMAILPGAMVGATLVGIVKDLDAVTLKDSGGIYWLDSSQLDRFTDIADGVESVSDTRITPVVAKVDESMARALQVGIADEVQRNVVALMEEVARLSDEDALNARKERAEVLHSRIDAFSDILGGIQDLLHEKVKVVEEIIARITLSTVGV